MSDELTPEPCTLAQVRDRLVAIIDRFMVDLQEVARRTVCAFCGREQQFAIFTEERKIGRDGDDASLRIEAGVFDPENGWALVTTTRFPTERLGWMCRECRRSISALPVPAIAPEAP